MKKDSPETVDIYVSSDGNDSWSGLMPEPDRAGTDGPLATPAAAARLARQKKGRGARRRAVQIILRGGIYFLEAPLRLTGADSGASPSKDQRRKGSFEEDAPIVWRAYEGETPILSAGKRITGWTQTTLKGKTAWIAHLPEVKKGRWRFRQLFVNGSRAPRTRLPRRGLYRVAEALDIDQATPGTPVWRVPTRRIRFNLGEIKNWRNLNDVEVVAVTRWIENRLPLKSVDARRRIAEFDRPSLHTLLEERTEGVGAQYWVENVYEALDTPGQWYLDRATGRLTYLPRRGETPENTQVVAPLLDAALEIFGAKDRPVKGVRFEGINFAHAEWQIPEGWCGSTQAAHEVPGALRLFHARDVAFNNCSVSQAGTYGVEVGEGCLDVTLNRCLISDLGAGGVKIEEGSARTTVSDCVIAHGGRIFPSAVGALIRHSPGNKLLHNEIFDHYYTGISVGWVWGYGPNAAVGNIIEHNHVHHLGQGLLSDMGGIYTLGVSPGTRIRFNSFHDINCRIYGGWGIYTDEGSSDILIEKNLAYNCDRSGFHQNYGRDNMVQNNIFAFGAQEQISRNRIEDHTSFIFRRNIVLQTRGETVGRNDPWRMSVFENNLYWHLKGEPLSFYGKTWEEWRALGMDEGGVVTDPGFADPENGDFAFSSFNAAHLIGFEPFDLTDIGPRPNNYANRRQDESE